MEGGGLLGLKYKCDRVVIIISEKNGSRARCRWFCGILSSDSEKLVTEEKEARWASVFCEDVWDEVGASLVDWFDVAGLVEVSDVMERETNMSALGWDLLRLDEFDC